MENTAEANTVLEDLVDVQNCVIGLLRSTICHVVYVQYHLRHLLLPLPASTSPEPRPDCLPSHFLPLCGIRIRNPLSQYLAPAPFLFFSFSLVFEPEPILTVFGFPLPILQRLDVCQPFPRRSFFV